MFHAFLCGGETVAGKKKDPERPTQRSNALVTPRTVAHTLDGCFGLIRTSIRMAGAVFIVALLWLVSKELAGKKTEVSGVLDAAVQISLDRWVFLTATTLASYFWWRERRLRMRVIKEHQEYIRALEQKLDPGRSSSGLREDGKPRKEDLDAP